MAAFRLQGGGPDLNRKSGDTDVIVIFDDKEWIIVDMVFIQQGFMRAWEAGAGRYRESSVSGASVIYPVRAGWKKYGEAKLGEEILNLSFQSQTRILDTLNEALSEFQTAGEK